MAILGCNFNINFDQTLAPGSSLCNTLRAKLHAWTESSIIVEFMVKFIWQHNLPVESYHTFKMPPWRLDFWCSKGKNWDPPVTPKLEVREVSQSGFWNISSHPASVRSFSQIGWPPPFGKNLFSRPNLLMSNMIAICGCKYKTITRCKICFTLGLSNYFFLKSRSLCLKVTWMCPKVNWFVDYKFIFFI